MKTTSTWLRFLPLLSLLLAVGCSGEEEVEPPIERDLARIGERDTLSVLTTFNSTSYFLYRGQPMGFEYELLRAFADSRDLEMKIEVLRDRNQLLRRLNRGEGDVAAGRLSPSVHDTAQMLFTRPLYRTAPTLVQQGSPPEEIRTPAAVDSVIRRGAPNELPDSTVIRARLVRNPADLGGKEVHVTSEAIEERLVELSDTVTGDIEVVEVEGDVSTEALIRQVARGEIELAAAPENLAELRQSYFSNIVVRPTVGPPLNVAWAVRRNAPELQNALDEWIAREQREGGLVHELYQKYFVDRRGYREREESEYLTSETGRLSEYDALLKESADRIGWDWRLLASQAYQESKFDPSARSWAGAMGLLQLMPGTAREVGVNDAYDPAENVAGGVRYLEKLWEQWTPDIPDVEERMKFVLASYNTGRGHVLDAQRLTEKYGGDPQVWDDVAYWLLQKSKRQYYQDPVVRHGFARGLEPVTYVSLILERFDHYKEFVVSEEESS